MTSYEFWEELSKIFNAVVSYQEKSIEFNNRFITPWVRLGNVFDKEEHQREEIVSYKNAVEMDPDNAQLWFELGNLYLSKSEYDDALPAFRRAIELNPDMGWAYSNLGTVYMSRGNYEKAAEAFERSIVLFEDDKEKAVSWNKLGNLYRKTNQYPLALNAFQQADELDASSCVTVSAEASIPIKTTAPVEMPSEAQVSTEEAQAEPVAGAETQVAAIETLPVEMPVEAPVSVEEAQADPVAEAKTQVAAIVTMPVEMPSEAPVSIEEAQAEPVAEAETQVAAVETQEEVELTTEYPQVTEMGSEVFMVAGTTTISGAELQEIGDRETDSVTNLSEPLKESEVITEEVEQNQNTQAEVQDEVLEIIADITQLAHKNEDTGMRSDDNDSASSGKTAYEEYLNDEESRFPLPSANQEEPVEDSSVESMVESTPDPVTIIDSFGEVQMEIDINNAKVWNELGNVYYSNGALEDAIVAYAKSIELDRNFAWPYSNLALVYVQKDRLAEAILLYQRSIELFIDDKDKAVAWNCLGNVYRRVDDYSNAISAYQRADDLDPNNISSSFQSRYSLLGTLTQPQEAVAAEG